MDARRTCSSSVQRSLGILVLMLGMLLSACSAGDPFGSPADTVSAYFKALEAKDLAGLINVSCADWEARARLDFESFNNLEIQVSTLDCQEVSGDGDTLTLQCEGNIETSYGNEARTIPLSAYEFVLHNEDGEWVLCSY